MNLEDIPSLYLTDSSTALYWIQHEVHWDTFVNNRVEEIRNLSSKEAWKQLLGTCNPAHLPSRGCSVQGLIRLKTKISRRDDAENFISPLLLPSDHPLVERLIYERHLQSSHAGTQVVLTDIHQLFWLLWGRKTVQRVISKAIHLELIQSLSTNGFLLGFRRFISKRGRPKIIYSNNETNFTGDNNWISGLDWDRIVDAASVLRIQWKFKPLTAAWWGGFWERLIQMVKKLLRRVLGKSSLYYEEIFTILCDIEATINSRPLNCLSEDPKDLTPLTPSMFIQETRTVGVPDLEYLQKIPISTSIAR
ncbi:integrase catalytic domain-containing protein [Trichonephila clavipes]|nr:integrase catalytic domain-containing protein [Trichonephila clavipes]